MKPLIILTQTLAIITVIIAVLIGSLAFYKPGKSTHPPERYYKRVKHGIKLSAKAVWGVDLSHHQGVVNWKEINSSKPKFAFLKVTEGISHTDRKYKKYIKEIRSRNILVGSYHFFSHRTSGKKQAKHFIRHIDFKKGDLPPVIDAENSRKMPAKSKVSKELLAFIETVENELGVKPIIYCTDAYYNKYLKGNLTGSYVLWICDFRNEPKSDYSFWQKTDQLDLPGFMGLIDYNVFNGSYDELVALTIK